MLRKLTMLRKMEDAQMKMLTAMKLLGDEDDLSCFSA
jgi:hypothetical protein